GLLMLLDPEQQELSILAAIGLPKAVVKKTRIKIGQGIAGWVAKTKQPLILNRGEYPLPEIQQAMVLEQIDFGLYVPLVVQDESMGVLNVSRTKEAVPFTESDLELLLILSKPAAMAVQNTKLLENIARQQYALKQLKAETIQAEENERKMVALEIHDVISQAIASLFYRIQTCERLLSFDVERARKEFSEIKRMAQNTLDDVTRLMLNLRPPVLDDVGVFPALHRYIDQYQRENGIRTKIKIKGRRRRFHPLVEISIYRIVQEALTNIRRHAEASRVVVEFKINQEKLEGLVEDNGKGFNPNAFLSRKEADGHLGLFSMKERAALLDGTLEVKSSPGRGTAVRFELPILPRRKK
ncbi:MAG: GAF domain-containing sensor histidine kinase, partial [Dehalococcoidales bacterium]|nr:GAF domain-containing sensor histidine kinase [Dehalococcoidales bacterium]